MAGSSVARFGTDGVRGLANDELTAELAVALGRAAARVLGGPRSVVIGRDTRRSGPMLEAAVAAGVCAEGADVRLARGGPHAGRGAAAARDGVPGIVISASHNPYADNGIKLFGPGGRKLTDAEQSAVEDAAAVLSGPGPHPGVTGAGIGTVLDDPTVLDAYLDDVVGALEGRDLAGVEVVLDCANGANSVAAPARVRAPRRDGHGDRTPRPTDSTSTTPVARPIPRRARTQCAPPVPTPGSPSTATPTGCSPSATTARSSTATRSSLSLRPTSVRGVGSRTTPWSSRS